MAKQLAHLSAFLENEHRKVVEAERALSGLKSERASLEPVVTAQRETVEAILAAHSANVSSSCGRNAASVSLLV